MRYLRNAWRLLRQWATGCSKRKDRLARMHGTRCRREMQRKQDVRAQLINSNADA